MNRGLAVSGWRLIIATETKADVKHAACNQPPDSPRRQHDAPFRASILGSAAWQLDQHNPKQERRPRLARERLMPLVF
jgi:hypothetical protein